MDFELKRRDARSDVRAHAAPAAGRPDRGSGLAVGAVTASDERDADAVARSVLASISAGDTGRDASGTAAASADRIRRSAAALPRPADPGPPNRVQPAVIRRKLAFKSGDLSGTSIKAKLKTTTWVEIKNHLQRYEKAADPSAQLPHLQALEVLTGEWLHAHAAGTSTLVDSQRGQLQALLTQVRAELAAMGDAEDAQYTSRMNAHRGEGRGGDTFKYVSGTGAKGLVSTDAPRNADTNAKYGQLTPAELAAIRVYTGGDYRTMNPTLQDSDAWLQSQTHQLTGEQNNPDPSKNFAAKEGGWNDSQTKQRMQKSSGKPDRETRRGIKTEAMQHSRVATKGLMKLPVKSGEAFRGFTVTPEEFVRDYSVGSVITYKPFVSTSTDRAISEAYAKLAAAPKFGVLMVIDVKDGRDVDDISLAKGEREILVLPGSKFKVVKHQPPVMKWRPPGVPPEISMYVIEVTQIAGAGGADLPVPAPVPANALGPQDVELQPGPRPRRGAVIGDHPPAAVRPGQLGPAPTPPTQMPQLPQPPTAHVGPPVPMPAVLPPAPAPLAGAAPARPTMATPARAAGPVPAKAQAPAPANVAPALQPPQADPDGPLKAAAAAKAAELMTKARQVEPAVTALLQQQAKKHGAQLEGLQHRLKTDESLARKLADRARTAVSRGSDPRGEVNMQAMGLNDVLRYTLVTSEKKYASVEQAATAGLSKAGWAQAPGTRGRWNAWEDHTVVAYNGINLTFMKDGLMFELQLHTRASFDTKMASHQEYEEWRDATTTPERKKDLSDRMKSRWTSVPAPKGIDAAKYKGKYA